MTHLQKVIAKILVKNIQNEEEDEKL